MKITRSFKNIWSQSMKTLEPWHRRLKKFEGRKWQLSDSVDNGCSKFYFCS